MLKEPTQENRDKYTSLNKEVKKALCKAKAEAFQRKVQLLEELHHRNDSHNLFKTVRELEGKPKKPLCVIKDKNGIKHNVKDVLNQWK